MPEQQLEEEAVSKKDVRHFEEVLQKLWEKARLVSDLLIRVKSENKTLQDRVSELEAVEMRLKSEFDHQSQEFQRIRKELLQLQSNGSNIFTKDEKEELKTRIKDLIVKINSRL
ncbi:MAG: hypothetical protein WBD36_14335 [Bacteroidota bacterium]